MASVQDTRADASHDSVAKAWDYMILATLLYFISVYSVFAFCEYLAVLANIFYHYTGQLDFSALHLHVSNGWWHIQMKVTYTFM